MRIAGRSAPEQVPQKEAEVLRYGLPVDAGHVVHPALIQRVQRDGFALDDPPGVLGERHDTKPVTAPHLANHGLHGLGEGLDRLVDGERSLGIEQDRIDPLCPELREELRLTVAIRQSGEQIRELHGGVARRGDCRRRRRKCLIETERGAERTRDPGLEPVPVTRADRSCLGDAFDHLFLEKALRDASLGRALREGLTDEIPEILVHHVTFSF